MRLTFCYRHIAPYHQTQLNALVQSGHDVTVLSYDDFSRAAFAPELTTPTMFHVVRIDEPEGAWDSLQRLLKASAPEVVLFPGWGHAYGLAALSWSVQNNVPCVVISDSQEIDYPRQWWLELIKRRIVRLFAAGFVAGQRSQEYLVRLGMFPAQIVAGCDVVDNEHFSSGAICARENATVLRPKLGLPEHFFLAVNRLVPEKNVSTILSAFAKTVDKVISDEWELVILGDGPLRDDLTEQARAFGIESRVRFVAPQNYQTMPHFYGLASALILASTTDQWGLVVNEAMASSLPVIVSERCGCVPDLVQDGVNGFTFAPGDSARLAEIMCGIAAGRHDVDFLGRRGREIIDNWSMDRYVENLTSVVNLAKRTPLKRNTVLDNLFISRSISQLIAHRFSS